MIGKTISRYRILGQVGEGGMGVVYVAEDTVLGRRVAVKIPHAGREESHYRSRFLREARSVSKLRHPNIAAVHDFGETEDGQPFIVMELVSGQTLGDLLAGPGLSIARAVEIARQTADALAEAHSHGIVHRDIKPSNVVVDDDGEVKVLDFGLAKQLHEEGAGEAGGPEAQTLLTARTRSDVVIGTPLYLSPEQARGSKVDGRSDLFALGALLYECLTGRPAFSGANVIEIGAQVLHFDPPPPSRFNPRVPAELDRLVRKALAKRPEDRFQTAAEFAAELARVRSRLPDSDTATTRRLAGADNGHRSSALITMAEGLRRPKFSPLALVAALAALLLVVWGISYARRPALYRPSPEALSFYEQGVAAMREGAYYRASELLTRAVERDDRFVLAHARLAEAYMELDFLDRAKDEMLAATTLAPDFSVFPRGDALYLQAVRATLRQDYAGAVAAYEEIVKLGPNQPQAHLDLGRAYDRSNQTEKAILSYTEAARHGPSYAAAFLRLGTLHARKRNQPGAAAAFDNAQRLYAAAADKEGEAAVHYQRGRLFISLGKPQDARPELERSFALAREANNVYQQVQALQQLAVVQDDAAEAERLARSAVDLAQASGMNDQVAMGYITLATVFFTKQGKYDEAERNYEHALGIARSYKLRRYEAQALTNLSGLRDKQGRADDAEQLVVQAREFYLQGGYRREADQCAMLIARSRRRKGDYEGALKIFEEQLRFAEQSGDMGQAGSLHQECGAVLLSQERYTEALEHFRQSATAARALRNTTLLTYSLLNQANALLWLGRFDEAGQLLSQLEAADPQTLGAGRELMVSVHLNQADLEIGRRRYPEAAAEARQALSVFREVKGLSNELLAVINADLGLAESLRGSRARGRELCEEAARLVAQSTDLAAVARVHLALAIALLEGGDAAGARAAALRAHEIYAGLRRADSEWRALAVAAKASRRAGDEPSAREYLSRAASSLAQLQQRLGPEAATYLSRPDVQWLRSEFGVSAASAAH